MAILKEHRQVLNVLHPLGAHSAAGWASGPRLQCDGGFPLSPLCGLGRRIAERKPLGDRPGSISPARRSPARRPAARSTSVCVDRGARADGASWAKETSGRRLAAIGLQEVHQLPRPDSQWLEPGLLKPGGPKPDFISARSVVSPTASISRASGVRTSRPLGRPVAVGSSFVMLRLLLRDRLTPR